MMKSTYLVAAVLIGATACGSDPDPKAGPDDAGFTSDSSSYTDSKHSDDKDAEATDPFDAAGDDMGATSDPEDMADSGDIGTPAPDMAGSDAVRSTLTMTCDGELQSARVLVNYNTNLGVVFTEPEVPYTMLGSIQFDYPPGFSGAIENPEQYEPDRDRYTLSVSTRTFTTFGNHCWPVNTEPQSGTGTIEQFEPSEGIVRARFDQVPLNNCVSMNSTCVLNGELETSELGVFE